VRLLLAAAAALALAGIAAASAPPVGPLPTPKVTTVRTTKGSLVSVALPRRAGYEWRIARAIDSRVVRQLSEGDIGSSVVVVFKAVGRGRASIVFAETKGETAKAYRAVRYVVEVAA
jgi:hypothetical protein